MPAQYSVGSKVWLISGGPAMTIQEITGANAVCIWFDKYDNLQKSSFPIDVLTTDNPRSSRFPS